MNGFFQLQRKFFSHWLWKDDDRVFSRAEAFLDLLQLAAFTRTKKIVGVSMIELDAGQIVASERFLAGRWKWSTSKVRAFLTLLEADRMAAKEIKQGVTVLTLCNYKRYISSAAEEKAGLKQLQSTIEAASKQREEGGITETTEREQRARETDHPGQSLNSMQPLVDRVNSLRPEWKRVPHFTASEMYALSGSAKAIESLDDNALAVIRRFLAYKPRGNEKLWQVKSREKFMEAPADVLAAAEEWDRKNGGGPRTSTNGGAWK